MCGHVLPATRRRVGRTALEEFVIDGLARPLKELPSELFYDDRGSALFERICELYDDSAGVTAGVQPQRPACRQPGTRRRLAGLDLRLELDAREELRTEISAKVTRERLRADLTAAGLGLEAFSTDDDDAYGLSLSRLATGAGGSRAL